MRDIDRSVPDPIKPSRVMSFKLPPDLYRVVKEFAWRKFRYVSEVIRAALIDYLQAHDEEWETYADWVVDYRNPKLSEAEKLRKLRLSQRAGNKQR